MAGIEDTIERLLTLTAEKAIASLVLLGTASNVNKDNDTCDVIIDEGFVLHEVRLRSVIDEGKSKMVVYPKEDSHVLVLMMGSRKMDGCLIKISDPEEIRVSMDEQETVINKDGVVFNNKGENLNTVLADFITEVTKIIVVQGTSPNVPALEAIKQRLNTILK